MTSERIDGPTPNGGDYSIGVYVDLESLSEVNEAEADGLIITEYTLEGTVIHETVGTVSTRGAERRRALHGLNDATRGSLVRRATPTDFAQQSRIRTTSA